MSLSGASSSGSIVPLTSRRSNQMVSNAYADLQTTRPSPRIRSIAQVSERIRTFGSIASCPVGGSRCLSARHASMRKHPFAIFLSLSWERKIILSPTAHPFSRATKGEVGGRERENDERSERERDFFWKPPRSSARRAHDVCSKRGRSIFLSPEQACAI